MSEHPHKGALFHNVTGMIVDPSPDRLEKFFNGVQNLHDFDESSLRTRRKDFLCPNDTVYGLEGKGGYQTLQKIRTGLLESLERNGKIHNRNVDASHINDNNNTSTTTTKRRRRSKILCMVYTVHLPNDNHYNLRAQAHTWGRRCDGFIGASNYTDHSIGAIDLLHQGIEDYSNMWQKVRSMWAYAYDHYKDEYDFFYICGDDTYVVVENLRAYVDGPEVERLENGYIDRISEKHRKQVRDWKGENITSSRPLIFGTPLFFKKCPSPAGGSGYMFNRAALDLFGKKALPNHLTNFTDSREDIFVGSFFCTHGVYLTDTQHMTYGGWRFGHDADEVYYYEGKSPLVPSLLEKIYGFPIRLGMDSMSYDAISLHLKGSKKRVTDLGFEVADLNYRYEVVLYDMCSKVKQ